MLELISILPFSGRKHGPLLFHCPRPTTQGAIFPKELLISMALQRNLIYVYFLIFIPHFAASHVDKYKDLPLKKKESLSPGPKCFIEFASAEYCGVARLRCCTVHFTGCSLHRWRWSSLEPNAPRPKGRCIELEFHSVSLPLLNVV